MKPLDYLLRNWRYRIVAPHIPRGCVIADIGGHDGSFLKHIRGKIGKGICIDPLATDHTEEKIQFVRSREPGLLPFSDSSFDVVTLLAVYEHLGAFREPMTAELFRVLREPGLVLMTVPERAVDSILKVLLRLKLADGMSLEEHEHFDAGHTVQIFERCGFSLRCRKRFQFGLNNLFIFEKEEREPGKRNDNTG